MYHGITMDETPREWTQVSVRAFETQMCFLRDHYRVVSMDTLVDMMDSERLEPNLAAVTFDDGYRSVYELAYPILNQLDIPATVFMTTGFLDGEEGEPRYMWPDLVGVLLEAAEGETIDLTEFGLSVYELGSSTELHRIHRSVVEQLKFSPMEVKDEVIEFLNASYGSRADHSRHLDHRPMNWDQARALFSDERITPGGHTRTHPILSRLEPGLLRDEIVGGKEDLESRLGTEVRAFAYPNGRRIDYNRAALDLVRGSFDYAVTTVEGLNGPGQDRYQLRRVGIGNDLSSRRFPATLSGIYS